MTKLKIEYLATKNLTHYKNNSRLHSDAQVEQIAQSIQEFGFTNPILIDENNNVIAGHGRLIACDKVNISTIPCVRLKGLSEAQRKAYVIADNSIALNADWDIELLEAEIQNLEALDFDIDLMAIDLDDLDIEQEQDEQGLTDLDDIPEIQEKARTKLGDVWLLGDHRVMCGDSTNADDVKLLVENNNIDMVYTDPPYGIDYQTSKGSKKEKIQRTQHAKIIGDKDISIATKVVNLVLDMFAKSSMIFWGANYYCQAMPTGYGWLFWDKKNDMPTFSDGEFAFTNKGVKSSVFRHKWHGMLRDSEHGTARLHPNQKPVALAEYCFENYGDPKTVLDLFGGSGSTLIACEKENRKCFTMELDTSYCDVIVKRWQNHTGKQAKNDKTGCYFDKEHEKDN